MVGPDKELQLRLNDLDRAGALRRRVDELNIQPGTKVRLLTSRLKSTPRFVKGQEATWTHDLYTMASREGVNSFRINVPSNENPIWPYHALQVVTKVLGQTKQEGPKTNRRVVAAQTKEAQNISEKDQVANTLPDEVKRVPILTPKIAALIAPQAKTKLNNDADAGPRRSQQIPIPTAKARAMKTNQKILD